MVRLLEDDVWVWTEVSGLFVKCDSLLDNLVLSDEYIGSQDSEQYSCALSALVNDNNGF